MTSTVVIFGLFVLLAYNILANTSEAPSDLILIHIVSYFVKRCYRTAHGV